MMPEFVAYSIESCPDPDHGIHFLAQVPWEEAVFPVVGTLNEDNEWIVDEEMTTSIMLELMMTQETQTLEDELADNEYDWGGYI